MDAMLKKSESKSYTFSINTTKSPEEIFALLLDVRKWWSGFFEETFSGDSTKINDEFTFLAGGGLHFSKQKLIELVPNSKIVWLVMESNLSFLDDPNEWVNTHIRFNIIPQASKTVVTFTHDGLVPAFECYDQCTSAWTEYMGKLNSLLNE